MNQNINMNIKKNIVIICPKGVTLDYNFTSLHSNAIFYDNDIRSQREPEIGFNQFLSSHKDLLFQSDGILVSHHCEWQEAIDIILCLYLTSEWNLNNHSILWEYREDFSNIPNSHSFNKSLVPLGSQYLNKYRYPEKLDNEIEKRFLMKTDNSLEAINFEQIYIKPPRGSHQITNEWGAFKLAYTAELHHLLPEIEALQTASKTLYFKYLKRKFIKEIKNSEGVSNNISGKYLLIDDNYAKGWHLVFSEILKNANLGLDAFEEIDDRNNKINTDNEEEIVKKIKKRIKDTKYQGILLDLRLSTSDDGQEKSNTDIINFTGGRILTKLKKEFPFLPVIMVTASNKAWNMRQLLDAGADGYLIKEDPESNPSPEVSESSYKAFKTLITQSQKKYKALQPFWSYIEKIQEEATLIDEQNGSIVEKRIRERLNMFFGLLKRKYEDSQYNVRFDYSDIKLAFITLWSCLNDIQYVHYETNNDNSIKIRQSLINTLGINPNCQFLTHIVGNKPKTRIKENRINHTFTIEQLDIDGNKIKKQIGQQIAFLIYGFCSSNNDFSKRDSMLNQLFELKEKRNSHYLTHGDESGIFFQQLEKFNTTSIEFNDCARLFEIVYFLVKGEYIQVNV